MSIESNVYRLMSSPSSACCVLLESNDADKCTGMALVSYSTLIASLKIVNENDVLVCFTGMYEQDYDRVYTPTTGRQLSKFLRELGIDSLQYHAVMHWIKSTGGTDNIICYGEGNKVRSMIKHYVQDGSKFSALAYNNKIARIAMRNNGRMGYARW